MTKNSLRTSSRSLLAAGTALLSLGCLAVASQAQDVHRDHDRDHNRQFLPGNLVVSRTVYNNNPNNVKVGTVLPPNCAPATGACGASTGAPYNGSYPLVWNNVIYDASFGITAKIYLDQITPYGWLINSLEVPNNAQRGINSKRATSSSPASAQSPKSLLTFQPMAAISPSWATSLPSTPSTYPTQIRQPL